MTLFNRSTGLPGCVIRRQLTTGGAHVESRQCGGTRLALAGIGAAVLALGTGSALAISQSGEQKDMRRVGHTDLQGRAAYHP